MLIKLNFKIISFLGNILHRKMLHNNRPMIIMINIRDANNDTHQIICNSELLLLSLYICAWFGLAIALLMAFLKNALMRVKLCQINYIMIV